jgi:hypothetical protein
MNQQGKGTSLDDLIWIILLSRVPLHPLDLEASRRLRVPRLMDWMP